MNVAFDIGNVLVSFDLDKFYHDCFKFLKSKNSESSFKNEFDKSFEEIEQLNYCGLASIEAGIIAFLKKHSSSNSYSEYEVNSMLKLWNDQLCVNKTMLNWIKNLKSISDVKVAFLSNMGYEHFNLLKDSELFKLADVLHISCEVGAAKPKKLFFQSFLNDNPMFNGGLYLDDRIENVRMASYYGFDAKVFELSSFKKDSELKLKLKELENIIFSK